MNKEMLSDIFHEFGLAAEIVGVRQGPAVECYEIKLGRGVKLKSLETLMPDLARIVGDENIKLISPIGKGLLGKKVGDTAEIQVPSGKVTFEVLELSR